MSAIPTVDALAERLLSHRAVAALGDDLHVDMWDGIVLKAAWFDYKDKLAGSIKAAGKTVPLLEQRILGAESGKFVELQTPEQACAAFAQNAINLAERLAKAE